MKKRIKEFALNLEVDDVGVAAAADYQSPRSPKLDTIFPGVKSIVVMAYKEPSSCESPNMQVAMNGRLDVMEFSRSCNYKMVRFLEKEFGAKAMSVPASYPLEMSLETMGSIGDVSLRHAAIAAGLGVFGRHNLVIHPKLGTRVICCSFAIPRNDIDCGASEIPRITPVSCMGKNPFGTMIYSSTVRNSVDTATTSVGF